MITGKRKRGRTRAAARKAAERTRSTHEVRLGRLRESMAERKLDALLIVRRPNVYYVSGFTGTDSVLLISKRGQFLVTDFRFAEEAAETAPDFTAVLRKGPIFTEVAKQIARRRWRDIGYESRGVLAADRDELGRALRAGPVRGAKLKGLKGLVESLRAIKSGDEVDSIRRAIRIAEKATATALRAVSRGRTELEVARAVARKMEDLGASGESFDTIAAYDARASLPHAQPTDRSPTRRSVLLLDWGARVDSYCSDLTRVFTQHSIPAWLRRTHKKVLEAQRAAIECVGPGVRASDVDAAARGVLRKAGMAKLFGHGVGHGLGLEVHESPGLGPRSADVLRPGMVVTIEPGVYYPGRGGVRIEDDVLVTENGAEVLSRLPRALG